MAILQQGRRRFLSSLALAGAAGLGGTGAVTLGGARSSVAAEPPPEITTIRFEKDGATCLAPQVFQELLRAEGFTDIQYVTLTEAHVSRADAAKSDPTSNMIAQGEVDFGRQYAPSLVMAMNAGAPITVLSGLHLGCFEIFGKRRSGRWPT
jgi:NitT/TauT family transport system substrate-binding protein